MLHCLPEECDIQPNMAYAMPVPGCVVAPGERQLHASERREFQLEAKREATWSTAASLLARCKLEQGFRKWAVMAKKSRANTKNGMREETAVGGVKFKLPSNVAITNYELNLLRNKVSAAEKIIREDTQKKRESGEKEEGGSRGQFIMIKHSQRYLELAMTVLPGTSAPALANAAPLIVCAWMASAWGSRETKEAEQERHAAVVRASPGDDAIHRALAAARARAEIMRLAKRIAECGAKHFSVGCDKGQGKLVISISFFNPKEQISEQHTPDSRDSGEDSESVAHELNEVLSKYLPEGGLVQSCTDAGGGGVGTPLASQLAKFGIVDGSTELIVTFCSLHYLQTSLRVPWEKWLGAGGMGVTDAVKAAHSVYDVVKRVDWGCSWDASQEIELSLAAARDAVPPRFRTGALPAVYVQPDFTLFQLRPKKPSKPLFTRWWTMVVAMVTLSINLEQFIVWGKYVHSSVSAGQTTTKRIARELVSMLPMKTMVAQLHFMRGFASYFQKHFRQLQSVDDPRTCRGTTRTTRCCARTRCSATRRRWRRTGSSRRGRSSSPLTRRSSARRRRPRGRGR